MRAADLLSEATRRLSDAGIPEAGRDARRLLAFALDLAPHRLTLALSEEVSAGAMKTFEALIAARAERRPVSHLVGERLFYGRRFRVTPDVLDPRPETETLIEAALSEPFAQVIDLGTGSGNILLTLLAEREAAVGLGTDISAAALAVAGENASLLGIEARVIFAKGDWYDAVPADHGPADLIVANPPYIALGELPFLSLDVRAHEPRHALTDEADGLSAYRAILSGLSAHLAPGGRLVVEIGARQGGVVAALFETAGLDAVTVVPDLDGRDRVVIGRLRP